MPDFDSTDTTLPGLDDLSGVDDDLPGLDETEPQAAPSETETAEEEPDLASFDMPDFDMPAMDEPVAEKSAPDEDSFSLDDLGDVEPMEFMDTGAELSAPAKPAPASEPADDAFDISMDEPSMELDDSGLDSESGDLPGLDDMPGLSDLDDAAAPASAADDDDDLDFMAPPELTETPWAEPDAVYPDEPPVQTKGGKIKAPKKPKRSARPDTPVPAPQGGSLDKTALFLSLTSLSLLVLLILVLLFLNMIKSPQTPAIKPEVMRMTPSAPVANLAAPTSVDLSAGTTFEAKNVLEVPDALRSAEVSLTLAPGDTAADATRRFGPPAQTRGNQLFW